MKHKNICVRVDEKILGGDIKYSYKIIKNIFGKIYNYNNYIKIHNILINN